MSTMPSEITSIILKMQQEISKLREEQLENKRLIGHLVGLSRVWVWSVVTKNDKDTLKLLLKHGVNVNETRADSDSSTLLHLAAEKGSKDCMDILLIRGKAFIDIKNSSGLTPLHTAAKYGHIDCVKALLGSGADINAQDGRGNTPLHSAISGINPSRELIEVLLGNGAGVGAKNKWGCTPLHAAAQVYTPSIDIINVLCERGADVNAKDNEGKTPIYYINELVEGDYSAVIKALVEKKANINAKDNDGFTPLHYAIRPNQGNLIKILLENGADINEKNEKGFTPLDLARQIGYEDYMQKILQTCARVPQNPQASPIQVAAAVTSAISSSSSSSSPLPSSLAGDLKRGQDTLDSSASSKRRRVGSLSPDFFSAGSNETPDVRGTGSSVPENANAIKKEPSSPTMIRRKI